MHPPLAPPSQARVGDIMRRIWPHPEAAAATEPPQPAPRPAPEPTRADGARAQPGPPGSGVGGTSAGRTGYEQSWMVRGALWFYLAVLALSLVIGGGACMVRMLQMLAAALRRRHGSPEPPPLQAAYASDRLSDGLDAAAAQAAWQRRVAAAKSGAEAAGSEAPPPLPGQDSRVQDLLRSGKQNFSVSESRAVANFLARKAKQDDLLILCGKG